MDHKSKSERPRIHIPLQSFDYLLEILAALGLLALLGLSTYYYGQLPEQVPSHFGPDGLPDKYGSKNSLWLLPILGSVIFVLMTYVNRRPDWFNYPVKITDENARSQYTMASRLIRVLKASVTILFAYLVWGIVSVSNGVQEGLGMWFLVFPVGIPVLSIFYIFKSVANNS
jgi:uncharacterized membrane protein